MKKFFVGVWDRYAVYMLILIAIALIIWAGLTGGHVWIF